MDGWMDVLLIHIHIHTRVSCSMVHIDDVTRAFDTILHRGVVGATYNIGTDDERIFSEATYVRPHHYFVMIPITGLATRAIPRRRR